MARSDFTPPFTNPGELSEFDHEAHDHWVRVFQLPGLDPPVHIVNGKRGTISG
jgi:hypothetical protein